MAKVSIITALYNHEEYAARCFQSMVDQTYSHWELIIWDDGSQDSSLAVARSFADRHPERIKVFTHEGGENRGQERTRNAALEKATGALIGLLDSDDYCHPRKLESLVPCFENPKAGLAYGSAEFLSEKTGKLHPSGIKLNPSGKVFGSLVHDNFICAGAALFRRECVEDGLKFDDAFKAIGEYPLWLKIARDWELVHVPETVAVWRHHGENLGSRLAVQGKAELVALCERLAADPTYADYRDEIDKALVKRRYDYASELYRVLDLGAMRVQCAKIVAHPVAPPSIRAKAGAMLVASVLGRPSNKLLSRGKRLLWEMRHKDLMKK